jgi:hypothetical protein
VRRDIADDLARSLTSVRQEICLMALARLLLNICYGVDTERGAVLAAAALSVLTHRWRSHQFENHTHLEQLCVSILNACVYAHFQEGRWDLCPGFLETAAGLPGVRTLEEYWNAPALVARIKVAGNELAAAQELLDQTPFEVGLRARQVSLARATVADFKVGGTSWMSGTLPRLRHGRIGNI